MRVRVLTAAALCGLLGLLTGCSSGGSAEPGASSSASAPSPAASSGAGSVRSYAALGDSYSSAPYVYLTDAAGGCFRSDHNYPSLLAERLGLTGDAVRDVTCAGADTATITQGQDNFFGKLPAQIGAVRSDTDLVTLGIGGNDFNLFNTFARGCPVTGPRGLAPGYQGAGSCGGSIDLDIVRERTALIRDRVYGVLTDIRERAPKARVVLVGYPRLVDPGSSCPDLLPLVDGAALKLRTATELLDSALAAAAQRAGASYADMYAASAGHDVCAGKDAWVNGVKTDTDRALALHPFLAEQQAVATQVAALLK